MAALCCVTMSTTRTSLISGSDTNDESRNATVKRPGPPMPRAMPYIHVRKDRTKGKRKYPEFRHVIIARVDRVLAAAAIAAGIVAWTFYFRAGLVLSHYDAKAHLVVARRIIDNITPGWQQIGAVWLPLPHLINLLPTQIDFFYRTGVFASFVSIVCLGI